MLFTMHQALVALFCAFALCQFTFGQQNSGFQNPSPEYRPKFRYWLPDASVSSDIVANDIHAARGAGAGGFELLPFYLYGAGEATLRRQNTYTVELPDWSKYGFGTPAFVNLFKQSLSAAKDAGIFLDYALGPNQGAGVPSKVSTPGLSIELLMGNITISPQGSFSAPVPQAQQPSATILGGLGFQHPLEQFGTPNLTAVIAYQVLGESAIDNSTGSSTVRLNESSFMDLTSTVQNGSLQWTPPDTSKTWKIFSFWESYTNQRECDGGMNATDFIGNGSWMVDHFSKTGAVHVTEFWDKYILSDGEIAALLKDVGKYAWEDSMEILSALYWSPGLLERFRDTHNYELTPYLPLLFSPSNAFGGRLPIYNETYVFGNDTNVGENVHQLDYRSILNDGYQDYLTHFKNWSRSVGTEYSAQPAYNLPLQMLSDIPIPDAPEGESLGFSEIDDAYRQFAGPAHLANKSVISSELGAVNVAPYSLPIPSLLQKIKRSFSGGITMHVIHGFPFSGPYANTTWPGYTTFWYEFTEMWNEIQPAWEHMKDYLDFVGRNQWVLQQGSPKVDLALYLFESPWSPKTQYNSTNLQNLGYTYDYLGPDNLISSQATVTDGKLGIPQYKALIVNNQTVITLAAAEAISTMANNGLPIIFVGPPPSQVYPANASNQAALMSAIQRLRSYSGIYYIDTVDQIPATLTQASVKPSVALNCTSNPVYSVWRSSADVDYVYFFNDQNKSTNCAASIAASKVVPYIYNAWDGSSSPLLQYTSTNSSLTIPLALKSNESVIIALHQSSSSAQCSFTATTGGIQSLNTSADGRTQAIVTGPASLTSSSGKTLQLNASLPASTNLTTWDLIIEDWHSAPDRFAIKTEITNHTYQSVSLKPWNQIDASLDPVSGVGHYTTNFTVPASGSNSSSFVGILKLPLIQHTARAWLDGQWLGPIDPNNPVVTLKGVTSGASHQLKVDVTTTLFNRVKAEKNQTQIVGQTAGSRQPMYTTMAYQGYGLVGSVVLEWGQIVDVAC